MTAVLDRIKVHTQQPRRRVEEVTYTPQMAQGILDNHANPLNRQVPRLVKTMAADMAAGNFILNGETVVFGENGMLLDGHHRMAACVLAGVPFSTYVVRGVPNDAVHTYDSGAPRSYSQVLVMRGMKQSKNIAAVLRVIAVVDGPGLGMADKIRFSTSQLDAVLAKNQDLPEFLSQSITHTVPGPRAMMLAIWYLLHQRSDPELADWFFNRLEDGVSLTEDQPVYLLRAQLLRHESNRSRQLSRTYIAAILIKAWNATRNGETLGVLKWTRSGPKVEDFPEICW